MEKELRERLIQEDPTVAKLSALRELIYFSDIGEVELPKNFWFGLGLLMENVLKGVEDTTALLVDANEAQRPKLAEAGR